MAAHVGVTGDVVVAKRAYDAPFVVADFRHNGTVAHEMFQAATAQAPAVPSNILLCTRIWSDDVLLEEPFSNAANVAVRHKTMRKAAHEINRKLDVRPSDARPRRDRAELWLSLMELLARTRMLRL
jgi:hypothetical protein